MRPLIGITGNTVVEPGKDPRNGKQTLGVSYMDTMAAAGGAPVILPMASEEIAPETLARLDGLVLSGGADIPPQFFGAQPHPKCHYMSLERWHSECLWLRTAQRIHVPVLGICLGMQVMNVAAGGTLIQDISSERPGSQLHDAAQDVPHEITIVEGSKLAALAPALRVTVASSHHQAVDRIGVGYRAAATTADGIVEAIEWTNGGFLLGVQWHPERCLDQPNWVLRGFVNVCAKSACAGKRAGVPVQEGTSGSDVSYRRCPMSDVLRKVIET
jgi:putative glutamine amidotransferase